MAAKNQRIVKYKKPFNINIGVIIFGITFIYLVINVLIYFSKDKITFYEVVQGRSGTTTSNTYTGVALRDETVEYAENSGYINYYVREGNRVSKNSTLYTIDESGEVSKLLADAAEESSPLSKKNIESLQEEIFKFTSEFNTMDFDDIYDFKFGLESTILELMNSNSLDSINKMLAESGKNNLYQIKKATSTGIVIYSVDNYEDLKAKDITENSFNTSDYKKASFSSDKLVEAGSPIYKTISNETWTIVIPLTNADIIKYSDETTLNINFVKDDVSANVGFEIIYDKDDNGYGKLTLNNYMIRYATERFIDIQINSQEEKGLKIPKSALVEKDFYSIPKEYGSKGGDSNVIGFYKQTYKKDGTPTIEYIKPQVYNVTDEYYLVDKTTFSNGDIIVKNDSNDRFQISPTHTLLGVYNINSGYTVFRRVKVLAEASEYCIIETGTTYGLVIYDHIVLDGSKVEENEVVFQ